jgi:hypothetical protein
MEFQDVEKQIRKTESETCHVVEAFFTTSTIVRGDRASFQNGNKRTKTSDVELALRLSTVFVVLYKRLIQSHLEDAFRKSPVAVP